MCGTAYTNEVSRCILWVESFRNSDVYLTKEPFPRDLQGVLCPTWTLLFRTILVTFETICNWIIILQSVTDTMRRGFCLPLAKSHETYPSPTIVLDKLSKHVESLMRLGHSGVELKDVIVEGDVGLCMDLGMKGLIVSVRLVTQWVSSVTSIAR
jgi:hypothetical protein